MLFLCDMLKESQREKAMPVLWILLGLALGLGIGIWRQRIYDARLKGLAQKLRADSWSPALDSTAQLSWLISEQGQQVRSQAQEIAALRQILQNAPLGYLEVNEENQLIWCNAQSSRLLGTDLTFDPGQDRPRPRLLLELVRSYELDTLIEEARQSQKTCERDWMLYRVSPNPLNPKNEPAFPLRGHGIPLQDGRVAVFLENRQEAVTLLHQRDRWTSDVAHELKTPLTSIRLVAETLKPRIEPSLQGWLDRLLNETIRLSNLVEDLLNLSRLEGQDFQGLNLKIVDLPWLILAAWQSLEPLAKVKQLNMEYQGPESLLINLDESLIHRVLINLIDNAIKHSPPRTSVYVCLSLTEPNPEDPTEAEDVCIEVIDLGSGFHDKDLPYIFDRFYRADPSRRREALRPGRSSGSPASSSPDNLGGGTGLGLSIVQQIIEVHQGTIQAANHPDLGGGWLKIRLPGRLRLSQGEGIGHSPL